MHMHMQKYGRKSRLLRSDSAWTTLLLTTPTLTFLSLATWRLHHFSLHHTSALKSAAACYSPFAPAPTCFP